MLLGFSYLYVCNVFLQKAENNLKKASWPKICNIIFFFFFAYSSVGRTRKPTN